MKANPMMSNRKFYFDFAAKIKMPYPRYPKGKEQLKRVIVSASIEHGTVDVHGFSNPRIGMYWSGIMCGDNEKYIPELSKKALEAARELLNEMYKIGVIYKKQTNVTIRAK